MKEQWGLYVVTFEIDDSFRVPVVARSKEEALRFAEDGCIDTSYYATVEPFPDEVVAYHPSYHGSLLGERPWCVGDTPIELASLGSCDAVLDALSKELQKKQATPGTDEYIAYWESIGQQRLFDSRKDIV